MEFWIVNDAMSNGVSVKRGPDTADGGCGWENANRKMRIVKCGWKKMRMAKKKNFNK